MGLAWAGFVAVACLWGITNPLIKRGSNVLRDARRAAEGEKLGWARRVWWEWRLLLGTPAYAVPLLINMIGSVLYYLTVNQADVSLAAPVTNSLTFAVTALTGRVLGERGHPRIYLGVALVLVGTACCVHSKMG